ncbi:TPA: aquaporin family protein [Streptococcus suis]|nr:aquaporin family protein [Streptococcus suis]HEM5324539.1 aquaporin family protein [Streptococcus suis]
MTNELIGEVLGTALLILLGNGVVAGVVLDKSKAKDAGWIVITIGWGLAVAIAAFVSGLLGPAIRNLVSNTISEAIGTFVLVLGLLAFGQYDFPTGLGTLIVGGLIVSLGVSLGGPTGYALNPARDLGPRIMYVILPLKHKGDSDLGYALVPVVGPIIGGLLAALLYGLIF